MIKQIQIIKSFAEQSKQIKITQAATMIISKPILNDPHFDYQLLLTKRKAQTSFPSQWVFPGGKNEEQDKIRTNFSELITQGNQFFQQIDHNSLKLTAIRECFEEAALLCSKDDVIDNLMPLVQEFRQGTKKTEHLHSNDYLDLNKLIFVGRYIPPVQIQSRFDTQYYLYISQKQDIQVSLNETELTEYQWSTPLQFLELQRTSQFNIPPPIMHILFTLAHFPKIQSLKQILQQKQEILLNHPLMADIMQKQSKEGKSIPIGVCWNGDSNNPYPPFLGVQGNHRLGFDKKELTFNFDSKLPILANFGTHIVEQSKQSPFYSLREKKQNAKL